MNYSNMTLTEIACELQQGNTRNNEQFGDLCRKQVLQIINQKGYSTKDNAVDTEDLAQTVYCDAIDKIQNFDNSKASFNTWLGFRTKHVCSRESAKGEFRAAESLDERAEQNEGACSIEVIDSAPGPEDTILMEEYSQTLKDGILTLPQNQQRAVRLESAGYKAKEIARIMGVKSSDVSRWLNRAHQALRTYLEREDFSLYDYERAA